jgi:hypothetical protein
VVGGLAGLVILVLLIWVLFFRPKQIVATKTFASVMPIDLKTDDPGTRTQRPALKLLTYFHGRDSTLEVEPFTLEEHRQRENAPACPECGKGGLQKNDPQVYPPPCGKANGSGIEDSGNLSPTLLRDIAPPGLQRTSSQNQSEFVLRPISNPSLGASNSHGAGDLIEGSAPIITRSPSLSGMIQGSGEGTPPPAYLSLNNSTH